MASLLVLLALRSALAADPVDPRAVELAKLRRDVETLSSDLVQRKEDLRSQVRALEAQRLEIEVQLRREELRLAQARDEAAARQADVAAHAEQSARLVAPTSQALDRLRSAVVAGLPYRLAERTTAIDEIGQQMSQGLLRPEAAIARLWGFAEDELRLTRENGLDRQIVRLPEGDVLADVARLGMVALYYRTDGDEVGYARAAPNGWAFEPIAERTQALAVADLMSVMKHGVRTGSFVLPNPGLTP